MITNSEVTGKPNPKTKNRGVFRGTMQNPFKSSPQVSKAASSESLEQGRASDTNQNPGMFKGLMQKVNPFKPSAQDNHPLPTHLSSSTGSQAAGNSAPEEQEDQAIHSEHSSSSDSGNDSTIERHSIWYTDAICEVKNQPTEAPKKGTMDSSSDTQALPREVVEVQTLEMAEVPVPSWDEWNQSNQNDEPEEVVEQAADRVFMAAQLFVRFFNQRGASLQQRILELLALADSADIFHKKTVKACVGGGVASVAGSITTITGLVLAPFTAGASLIVTAVGIGVATAGGVASASANITDTVHSKTDRKKVEQMINDYEEEMKDIKECLEFLQEGMETLEEWNFEKYVESIAKKHLNKNVEHVMKEGGRAGKALMINTESLISTVQVLSVAGGAAKAAQVMSVTTGVMSGLFLALDIFFLAKDTMELKKGAKTEFAAKIREVCRDLQDGLLELNRIKEQLQKTIDGIEVEVDEEEEDEELLRSELKKLAEFEV
ncbi:hypothetical protein FQN60_006314 [Etheostoma spectabile]|uniref:Uncharacterized protein n=1 Tax=Etheostoma spectabile TaxID=54343 RepID=A0A5J5CP85_9PERO|nr:hypothetical protein FQN60_006314 [Etheostoma spectabile]